MLISIPPQLSVSRAVQYLKGKCSHKLIPEYQALRKRYFGQHLWARGYWVAPTAPSPSSGGAALVVDKIRNRFPWLEMVWAK